MKRILFLLGVVFVVVVLVICLPLVAAQAASSTNYWFDNELDADLDDLAGAGLIKDQLSSFRPVTRGEAGRQFAAALDHCSGMATPSAECALLQAHDGKFFATEIAEARTPESVQDHVFKPVEKFSLSYRYYSDPFSVFNNEGIDYGEGHNAVVQLQSHARVFKALSFFVQPALIYNQHERFDDESNVDVRLHKGYAKLTLYNFEIQAGRDSLWWGPGYHAALLMSRNAKPLDMIKLSNPEPVVLPWIFSYLGPVQFNLIFSQLHDVRTGAELINPFLYGLRVGIKPHRYLELGGSHLVMFSGAGRRDLSAGDVLKILYGNTNPDPGKKTDSNSQFAVDAALTIPNLKQYIFLADGLKVYVEWGAEDSGFPPDKRAYLTGLALYKPFGLETAVLRAEYADLSPGSLPDAWYRHPSYPMRNDGRVFGHHAGSDAEDIFVEWSQRFQKVFYKIGFDRERSGEHSQAFAQSKNQYFVECGYRIHENADVSLRYGYEDIKNFEYVEGERERNHFVGIETSFAF